MIICNAINNQFAVQIGTQSDVGGSLITPGKSADLALTVDVAAQRIDNFEPVRLPQPFIVDRGRASDEGGAVRLTFRLGRWRLRVTSTRSYDVNIMRRRP